MKSEKDMVMPRVIIREASYHYPTLRPVLFDVADQLCSDAVGPGSRVVVKPNLLAPAPPDRAIVTHPLVVKGVVIF
jgi:uncharacterized protein (DUF362 family)